MVSKSENIIQYIKEQERSFYYFLRDFLLDKDTFAILENIAKDTDVYIFSGVIRNFFLGYFEFRDIDIVIRKSEQIRIPINFIKKISIIKNSFDGYKIKVNNMNIDVWYLQNTWGIKEENHTPTYESLIKSSFFNFSAITFDFNKREFFFLDDFCEFLQYNYLDIVYKKNPNIPLCIVNTLYYIEKFDLALGYNLCCWVSENYLPTYDYYSVQIRHFGEIKYNSDKINRFYLMCKKSIFEESYL